MSEDRTTTNSHTDSAEEQRDIYSNLVNKTEKALNKIEGPPNGWMTDTPLSKELGVDNSTIIRFTAGYPDMRKEYRSKSGHLHNYNSPELCQIVREKFSNGERAPDGWQTNSALARNLGSNSKTVSKITAEYQYMRRQYLTVNGHLRVHNSPELCQIVREEFLSKELVPEGWLTNADLVKETGAALQTISKITLLYPDMRRKFRMSPNRFSVFNSPDLCTYVREKLFKELAPEGWLTDNFLAKELGVSVETIFKITQHHPEMRKQFSLVKGPPYFFNSPDLCLFVREKLLKRQIAPDGWLTDQSLSIELGLSPSSIKKITWLHPNMRKQYLFPRTGGVYEYNSPELCQLVKKELDASELRLLEKERQKHRQENFNEYLNMIKTGEGSDTGRIKELTSLFGGESMIDILYQLYPEYKNLPLPYVRSAIPEYLGEFLRVRGSLDIETLKASTEMLASPNLKNMLTAIIKRDCLKHFNNAKRQDHLADDREILSSYVLSLRERTKDFSSPQLNEVITEVETYFQSLYSEVNIPDRLVTQLAEGRQFPDLNQRINVGEIRDKHKMLIADEMGVGKSASAILAKESLGVEQAVVVAPSNVVATWQRYLSDKVDSKGKQVGYFKPGQAPSVLVVSSIEDLSSDKAKNYEYILLSQERLTDAYTNKLTALNFGILIVDESHKLKNIGSGKRSANLVRLAEKIDESDDQKYLALLSGTPVPNKVGDVAMVLKLLYPEKFADVTNSDITSQILQGDVLDTRSLLVERMEAKMLTESIEMPKLLESTQYVGFSKQEREIYDTLLDEDELEANQKIHLLRQYCINPQMLEITPSVVGSKNREVGESLRKDFLQKDKIVMFVNGYKEGVLRGQTTIFESLNLPSDVELMIIDGNNRKDRAEIQERFQTVSNKMLLVVNGQTADVGVDFSAGEGVKFYNEPWTEYDKRQQLGRVYRYGLKHDITCETFIVQDSIEDGIHTHIQAKYEAIEKLLRGIPLSEIEKQLVRQGEHFEETDLEVNTALAQNYLSSWGKLMKIFGKTKEIGKDRFLAEFLPKYGADYANAYIDIGSRSYQSNVSRVAGTVITNLAKETKQQKPHIIDIASGPEMLRRHIPEKLTSQIYSVDINSLHFAENNGKAAAASFLKLPIREKTFEYANLALALHYTKFRPGRGDLKAGDYERLEVLQEINRVLKPGGQAVMSLMYTLDLKDSEAFRAVIDRCGFKIIESLSGEIDTKDTFLTRIITLQKVSDCNGDTVELAKELGRANLDGLKFERNNRSLRDSRKILTHFNLGGKSIAIKFNKSDLRVLTEEHATTTKMQELEKQFNGIANIPIADIVRQKMARLRVGHKYILFKPLESASGAVRYG